MKYYKQIIIFLSFFFMAQFAYADDNFEDFSDLVLNDLLDEFTVVSASKHSQSTGEAPAISHVITEDDIHMFGFQSLAELLNYIASIYVKDQHDFSFASVRGVSLKDDFNTRILLLIDGHPMTEPWNMSHTVADGLGLDINSVGRVEVVLGSGSVLYGSSALLAIVNIVSKDPSGTANGLGLYARGETPAGYKAGAHYIKSFSEKVNLLLSTSYSAIQWTAIEMDRIELDPEENLAVHHPDQDSQPFLYGSELADDKIARRLTNYGRLTLGDFTVAANFSQNWIALPFGDFESTFDDPDNRYTERHGFTELTYRKKFGELEVLLRGSYDFYKYKDAYHYIDSEEDELAGEEIFYRSSEHTIGEAGWGGGEAQLNWQGFDDKNFLVSGIQYSRQNIVQNYTYEGDDPITIVTDIDNFGLYLQDELKVTNWLNLMAGARYDYYSNFGNVSRPKLKFAAVFIPADEHFIKLLYESGFRAPSVYEYAYYDKYMIADNPDLLPEYLRTVEAAYQYLSGNYSMTVSGYYTVFDELINSALVEIDGEELSQYRNSGRINTTGAEGTIRANFDRKFRSFLNVSYQETYIEIEDEEIRLKEIPAIILSLGLAGRPLDDNFYLGSTLQYLAERFSQREEERSTGERLVLNAVAGYENLALENLTLELSAKNLLDYRNYEPLSETYTAYRVPGDGRRFAVSIAYNFD